MVAALKILDGKVRAQGSANYLRVSWGAQGLSGTELKDAVDALVFMSHREGRDGLLLLPDRGAEEQLSDRRFWTHLVQSQRFQRIAAVIQNPTIALEVRMSGAAAGISTRTFGSELAARKWLRESRNAGSERATLLG